ncbi:MAG: hypothetical protein EHM80_03675 [Nitrospiraceae bacterium]|nr:MAG: hypothetical protein EHM80_03675 [Nitrospiraceae bacterium]
MRRRGAWASVCPQGKHPAEFVAGGLGETDLSRSSEGVGPGVHQTKKATPKLEGRQWYWVDDEVEYFEKEIEELSLPKERCIQVSGKGVGALKEVREELEKLRFEEVGEGVGHSSSLCNVEWTAIIMKGRKFSYPPCGL